MEHKEKKPCDCWICIRSRDFKIHIATVENEDAKKFFEAMYSHLFSVEEESDCLKLYQENLKNIYPRIFKEVRTLDRLVPGNELFPEINI